MSISIFDFPSSFFGPSRATGISTEISQKLILANQTSEEVNNSRNAYRPVAKCGAVLFFVITELSTIKDFDIDNDNIIEKEELEEREGEING